MEVKKIPNVFESLYRLARHGNYDLPKWRELLTGIHRKSNEKHRIRDVCLLYFSLSKGSSDSGLSQMEIRYRERGTSRDLGPLTLRDIADTYIPKVTELVKYMNTKQLAMMSKFLLMMNKLNEEICNGIISKIDSDNLKTTSRSFFNTVLALSESGWVNRDQIERLLTQRKDLLLNMNRIDLTYLLKTVSLHNIKNENLLNIISDKLEYYLETMKPQEILSTLHTLYKLNWRHEPVLMNLYFRIQNTLEQYQLKELVLVSKCLSHFNLKNLHEFFDLQVLPLLHQLSESMWNNNNEGKEGEILLLYKHALDSGSETFPKLLLDLPDRLNRDYQWSLLFSALRTYRRNRNLSLTYISRRISQPNSESDITSNNSSLLKETDDSLEKEETDNYLNLSLKSIEGFKRFMTTSDMDLKYLPSITGHMVEAGIDREDVLSKILEKITKTEARQVDHLVEVLHNLHTVDSEGIRGAFDEALRGALDDWRALDGPNLVRLLTTLLFRNKEVPDELLTAFKELLSSDTPQQESWQMPDPGQPIRASSPRRLLQATSDLSLEYLLYSLVFPGFQAQPCQGFIPFKELIVTLFKKIKTFQRPHFLKVLLYCLGESDQKLQGELLKSRRLGSSEVSVEVVPLDKVPEHLEACYPELESVLIKVDHELAFRPLWKVPGTREVLVERGSRARWDCLSRHASTALLNLNNYQTVEI